MSVSYNKLWKMLPKEIRLAAPPRKKVDEDTGDSGESDWLAVYGMPSGWAYRGGDQYMDILRRNGNGTF